MGLDISSKCIGIAYNNKNFNFLEGYYYEPPKYEDNDFHIMNQISSEILDKVRKCNPAKVKVEDYARYMRGKSKASTILKLAILNRLVCCKIQSAGYTIEVINVNTARANLRKILSLKDRIKKEEVPGLLEKHYNIDFSSIPKKYINDVADAIVLTF